MPVQLQTQPGGILEVTLTGKLTRQDYERFAPEVEQRVHEQGKLRVLVQMQDFHGWDAGALWEDIKFDFRHYRDFERVALVGGKRWQEWMARVCRPFTTAQIRYFDHGETEAARAWVGERAAREAA